MTSDRSRMASGDAAPLSHARWLSKVLTTLSLLLLGPGAAPHLQVLATAVEGASDGSTATANHAALDDGGPSPHQIFMYAIMRMGEDPAAPENGQDPLVNLDQCGPIKQADGSFVSHDRELLYGPPRVNPDPGPRGWTGLVDASSSAEVAEARRKSPSTAPAAADSWSWDDLRTHMSNHGQGLWSRVHAMETYGKKPLDPRANQAHRFWHFLGYRYGTQSFPSFAPCFRHLLRILMRDSRKWRAEKGARLLKFGPPGEGAPTEHLSGMPERGLRNGIVQLSDVDSTILQTVPGHNSFQPILQAQHYFDEAYSVAKNCSETNIAE